MTPPSRPAEVFDALPPSVQAYIRYLEARLGDLEPTNNAAQREGRLEFLTAYCRAAYRVGATPATCKGEEGGTHLAVAAQTIRTG